ncbi:MAG: hypothetical protein GF411_14070 [Candidatus Lokiarchaeota archaeon]|nr:hypothetical protein [Candidatus Lokiarchaeota archaeon]
MSSNLEDHWKEQVWECRCKLFPHRRIPTYKRMKADDDKGIKLKKMLEDTFIDPFGKSN